MKLVAQLAARRFALNPFLHPRTRFHSSSLVRHGVFSRCNSTQSYRSPLRSGSWTQHRRTITPYIATCLAAAIALTPVALAESSEHLQDAELHPDLIKNAQPMTSEQRMLEASDRERAEKRRLSPELPLIVRIWKSVVFVFTDWVYEPIATTLRFAHLVIIFVPVIAAVPLVWVGPRIPERSHERKGTLWWYTFLINSMERAGPAFIKLGQWAASRTDIFPTEMCDMMSRLHSNVDAHPLHATKRTVERAFGGVPFDDIFEEFDEKPLGIGAIAQVYRGKLKPSFAPPAQKEEKDFRKTLKHNVDVMVKSSPRKVPSTSVAIKVLHPRVDNVVHRDLRIMHFFATLLNWIPTIEWLSLPDEVSQFGEMMRLQLDLRIEANNLMRFRKNFDHRSTVAFPKPYMDYSSRDVLIEEFAHGIPLSAFLEAGGGVYQKEIADMGLDAFLHMLLIDNFIHADLHPGNIMVRFYKPEPLNLLSRFSLFPTAEPPSTNHKEITEEALARLRPHLHKPSEWTAELAHLDVEGYRPQLIFIDTGLVTELNDTNRKNFLDLFRAIANFDGYRAGHLMAERCRQPDAVIDREIFALKMQHLVLGVKSKTFALGKIKIGDILNDVLTMIRTHHVRLEGDYINVVISTLLLEGIGRSLDPNIDLFATSLPILRQLGAQSGASIMSPSTTTTTDQKQQEQEGALNTITAALPMLKLWFALETRAFLQSSVEDVESCIKYDLISPNV